jgi:uncharacterized protein
MHKSSIIALTAAHVKRLMHGEGTGHDWWHVYRVWRTALAIAKKEKGADLFIVQLAALLHDLDDWKFSSAGTRRIHAWLRKLRMEADAIAEICGIIEAISFKGAGVADRMNSLEGKIVQDADRLDGLGAIGIARVFAYGARKGNQIYDPAIKPEMHRSFARYKKSRGTSINHFYEKLLLLKGRMHTRTGKRLAAQRHQYMKEYLDQFFAEWRGAR